LTATPDCTAPQDGFNQTIWVLQNNGTGVTTLAQQPVSIDLTPPPPPTDVMVKPGNEALVVEWTGVDSALTIDVLGYQILCNRAGELQVFDDGTFGPGFSECAPSPNPDGGVVNGPNDGGVNGLDPRFACTGQLPATQRSARVKILQNGITYGVAVVSIDIHGNASAPSILYGTPVKTKSFYDVYRDGGNGNSGLAGGGLCTLGAGTTSRGAAIALAGAAALSLVVALRRRRRRP